MIDLYEYTWKNKPGITPSGDINVKPFKAEDIYKHIQKAIDRNSCYGILGENKTASIDMSKIAVKYETATLRGEEIVLSYKVLSTPCGQIVAPMLENGLNLEHRVQAVGIVEKGEPTIINFISFSLQPA